MWKNNDRIIDSVLIVLNCSMARYNGRLHCIVGVLPTCYKRKAATYFHPPGGTGLNIVGQGSAELAAGTGLKLSDFLGVFILILTGFCQEIKR